MRTLRAQKEPETPGSHPPPHPPTKRTLGAGSGDEADKEEAQEAAHGWSAKSASLLPREDGKTRGERERDAKLAKRKREKTMLPKRTTGRTPTSVKKIEAAGHRNEGHTCICHLLRRHEPRKDAHLPSPAQQRRLYHTQRRCCAHAAVFSLLLVHPWHYNQRISVIESKWRPSRSQSWT
jgi:hypothetical protein